MKTPEQTSFDFSSVNEPAEALPILSAQVLSLEAARKKKDAATHSAVYEAILNSIQHLGELTTRNGGRTDK